MRFPEALDWLNPWLTLQLPQRERLGKAIRIIPRLSESQLCRRFPDDSLSLLETFKLEVGDGWYLSNELSSCLDAIRISSPSLIEDPRYRKLEAVFLDS